MWRAEGDLEADRATLTPLCVHGRIPARFNTIFVAPQVAVQQIKQSSGATDASARFAKLCMQVPRRGEHTRTPS